MHHAATWLKSRDHQWLVGILALAAVLIFFRLDRADLQTDGAHYSLRALWLTDYLNTPRQSGPLQWFVPPDYEQIPTWTRLSFHDAPPLAFWIQHGFFRLFGDSSLVARLPGALAGLASVLLAYLIGRQLWGVVAGRLAALLLASSTLFVWSAREPYLESQAIAWMLLAAYAALRALQSPRWWLLFGAALGAALLTKYTTAFLLLAVLAYLVLYHRPAFAQRAFWLGLAITALLLSPVAVYNLKLYQTRGHLDLQLSRLVPSTWPQAKAAWPKLYADIERPTNLAGNFTSIGVYLWGLMTPLLAIGVLVGLGWGVRQLWRKPATGGGLVVLAVLAATLTLTVTGPAPRYLPIFMPWLALGLAGALAHWQSSRPIVRYLLLVIGTLILSAEILYNVNTNLTLQPIGPDLAQASVLRLGNDGYAQLASYLQPEFGRQPGYLPPQPAPRTRTDLAIDFSQVKGRDVFLYQGDLRWFSTFWYFQQQLLLHHVFTLHEQDLLEIAKRDGLGDVNWFSFFDQAGVRRVFYIVGTDPDLFDNRRLPADGSPAKKLEANFRSGLDAGAPGRVDPVYNPLGQPAFLVYSITLNP